MSGLACEFHDGLRMLHVELDRVCHVACATQSPTGGVQGP